ncbi:MAG TPA: hypothetical protein VFI70_04535 [Nitrososphaeraceae archaeon]|nr:hypothetical protein [Nitrososphaeraceae archaeon]
MSAEDNGSTTNSGKADAQDGQIAAHPDANFTQGKAADITVDPVKPSEPSVIYVDKQKGIPTHFFLMQLMKSLLDYSILNSN